jgi:hypothetical protein
MIVNILIVIGVLAMFGGGYTLGKNRKQKNTI